MTTEQSNQLQVIYEKVIDITSGIYYKRYSNITRNSLKSISIDITSDYPDYQNLNIDNIVCQFVTQGAGSEESTSSANYVYSYTNGIITITSSSNRFGSTTTTIDVFILPNLKRIYL